MENGVPLMARYNSSVIYTTYVHDLSTIGVRFYAYGR